MVSPPTYPSFTFIYISSTTHPPQIVNVNCERPQMVRFETYHFQKVVYKTGITAPSMHNLIWILERNLIVKCELLAKSFS